MPGFLQPIGLEIGLQQRELDQIVLSAAPADPFILSHESRKGVDRAGKITPLEG